MALWFPIVFYGGMVTLGLNLPYHPGKEWWCGLIPVALVFLSVSRYNLGASFSTEPRATRLITTGLYKRIRHPIYLFSGALMFATVMYLNWWWLFMPLGLLMARQDQRAHAENVTLAMAFPVEWLAWRRSTWF